GRSRCIPRRSPRSRSSRGAGSAGPSCTTCVNAAASAPGSGSGGSRWGSGPRRHGRNPTKSRTEGMSSGVPTEPGPEPAAEPSPSTAAADTASLPAAAEHTGRPFVGSSEVIQPAPGVGGDGAQAAATTVADGHKTDTRTGKRRRGGLSFLQELPFLLLVAFV